MPRRTPRYARPRISTRKRRIAYVVKGRPIVKSRARTRGKGMIKAGTATTLKGVGIPRRLRAKLVYTDNPAQWVITPGAFPYASKSYKMNSLYDLDPAIASGSPSHFSQLCAANGLYSNYRALGARYTITLMNQETQPIQVGVVFTRTAPYSAALGYQYDEAEFSQIRMLDVAGSGNARTTFSGYVSFPQVWGKGNEYRQDITTQAAYNQNPSGLIYCVIFARTLNGTNFANNLVSMNRFVLYSEFYDSNPVYD